MPASTKVLSRKMRLPSSHGLARQRLVSPLLAETPSLGVLVASAGSGKTTLLSQVAAAATSPVAWYRISGDDITEAALVNHLRWALSNALSLEIARERKIDALLAAVDSWSAGGALLVLDDVHEIEGTAAERALERFVTLRPDYLRVLLGSRRPPRLNLSRLRVSGEITELTTEDLRFRSWEVEQLFVDVYGEPLPPEAAAKLARRTGGWAAGLQMFHLATAGKPAAVRSQAVAELGGRSRLVRSYLARNVLAELTVERRTFLIRTSALGVLTGALCDDLLETTGSDEVLQELERDQIFTSSDDDGRTFRYHQVLQTHLEAALLETLGREATSAWYRRSAQLLESAGLARESVRAFAHAEDWLSVARVIRQGGPAFAAGTTPDLHAIMPAGVWAHDPWLALAEARRLVRHGLVGPALDAFGAARQLLDEPGFTNACISEQSVVREWLDEPTAPNVGGTEQWQPGRHWMEDLRLATRALPGGLCDVLPGNVDGGKRVAAGLGALLAGRLSDARVHLDSANATSVGACERVAAAIGLAVVELLNGSTGDVPRQLEEMASYAEGEGYPWLARLAHAMLDAVLVSTGAASPRSVSPDGYVDVCERDGDDWGAAILHLAAGGLHVLAGGSDGPELARAGERFRRLHAPVLELWVQAFTAIGRANVGDQRARETALEVDALARRLAVPGARALACALLALDVSEADGRERRRLGTQLAEQCGFALPAVTSRRSGGPDVATLNAAAPPPELDLRCLGGFSLRAGGNEIALGGIRPRALLLLRFLALHVDQDVHRERVVEALWPDATVAAGTRSMHVAISSLRRALDEAGLPGSRILQRRGVAYRLALPPGSSADVRDLELALRSASRAAAKGDREAAMAARAVAVDRYMGELLPEDGPAEWVVEERERLRLAVADAARVLASDCLDQGAVPAGVAWARRSVQLDAFSDSSWRLLAELHDLGGDRAAGERARSRHRQVLRQLDVLAPGALPVAGTGRR